MIATCLRAFLSHWRRKPIQLFAFLAGLALATALWSGVQAINAEARASYDAAAATLGEGQFDQLVARQDDRVSEMSYVKLRRSGWLVSPVIEGELNGVRLIGVDPLTSPGGLNTLGQLQGGVAPALAQTPQLVARADVAQALDGLVDFVIDPAIAPGVAIGDVGVVQTLLQRTDLSRLILAPEQPQLQPALESIAPELRRQAAQQVADIAQLTDSFHLNLTAFGLLSFAVGLFIVHSTIGLAFEQRRGMVRTLRALGVSLRVLITLITLEMFTLAVIGAGAGVVIGYFIAAVLLPDVAATLQGLYGARVSGTLVLRPEWWLTGLLLGLLGTAFALTGRLWQVAQMPLLASVRPREWIMAGARRGQIQLALALTLLLVAAVLALMGTGLVAGFTLLGCLLIGAALALPSVARFALGLVEARAKKQVWQWFWADTRQQLPGLSLALMALLLAVSANIGVSTMVSSFRLTFIGFLDQRLAPELFIQVDTAAQSQQLEALLLAQDLEVLPLYRSATRFDGRSSQLYGVRVGPTYRNSWAFLAQTPAAWDSVEAGEAVVVNEQLARRANLWVGDTLQVAPDLRLPIAAVVGDYGNPEGQVIVTEDVYRQLHPDDYPAQFGVRTPDPDGLRTEIISALNLPQTSMIDQAAIKALSLEVFERTFTVTAALNVLTLGVAGFAILMSLLTLADLRIPQLAPVWALGFTRRHLGLLELLRAFVLALLVFACALPLGLMLAWVLLTIVNVEAFGWQLPMFLFPISYLQLGAYALIATVLAAAWPATRLMKKPPSALLKVFANER